MSGSRKRLGYGWIFLGLCGLMLVAGSIGGSGGQKDTKLQEEALAKRRQEEEASRAQKRAALEAELTTQRPDIVRKIGDLMKAKDYQRARQEAERFHELNDPEVMALSAAALVGIEQAELARRKQEEQRVAATLKKLKKTTDKVDGVDWYRDKSSPTYNNQNGFFLYIGKRGGDLPWLRLCIQYMASDWLFIESFVVVADDQRFEYDRVKFERDHDSRIWEWYDGVVTAADMAMLRAVALSKDAVIRFHGRVYRADRPITVQQKAALRNVLEAYWALGGQ